MIPCRLSETEVCFLCGTNAVRYDIILLLEYDFQKKKKEKERMRKLFALMLALCLALTMVPVMAEEDFSGTWYLQLMGLTGGTFELNADGTCVATSAVTGEEQTVEGSWSAEGNTVTLNIQDTDMPLTFDGTNLVLGEAAMSAFGQGMASSGMDASVFSALINFSRDPGLVTVTEFSAYQENGTLPEGKTQEEMETIKMQIMVAAMSMAGSMSIGTGTDDPAPGPAAAAELTVLEDNFYLRKSYGERYDGIYIARVQNNTEAPLYIDDGLLILKDAEGNEAGREEYLDTCGSRYLEPGEISFVSIEARTNEGAVVETYEVSFDVTATDNLYLHDTSVEIAGAELRLDDDVWANYYTAATLTNAGDAPLSNVNVIMVLKDTDGKLLELNVTSLNRNELAPGSTITLVESVDGRTKDYCTENNITLSEEVEAYGWANYN